MAKYRPVAAGGSWTKKETWEKETAGAWAAATEAPTVSDDVEFHSGAGNMEIAGTANCRSFNGENYEKKLTHKSFTWKVGTTTESPSNFQFKFGTKGEYVTEGTANIHFLSSSNVEEKIYTANKTLPEVEFITPTTGKGKWKLEENYKATKTILGRGIINLNEKVLETESWIEGSGSKEVKNGTIKITGTGTVFQSESGGILSSTVTVEVTNSSATEKLLKGINAEIAGTLIPSGDNVHVEGGGLPVNNLYLYNAGTTNGFSYTGVLVIKGEMKSNGTAGNLAKLLNSTEQNMEKGVVNGEINVDYIEIKNSKALTANGQKYHAGANSVNVSGNTNWQFGQGVSGTLKSSSASSLPLKLPVTLQGTETAKAKISGGIVTAQHISSTIKSVTKLTGTAITAVEISGSATVKSALTSSLNTPGKLFGTLSGIGKLSGGIVTAVEISGSVTTNAKLTAPLKTAVLLSATMFAKTTVPEILDVAEILQANVTSTAKFVGAEIIVRTLLSGEFTGKASVISPLRVGEILPAIESNAYGKVLAPLITKPLLSSTFTGNGKLSGTVLTQQQINMTGNSAANVTGTIHIWQQVTATLDVLGILRGELTVANTKNPQHLESKIKSHGELTGPLSLPVYLSSNISSKGILQSPIRVGVRFSGDVKSSYKTVIPLKVGVRFLLDAQAIDKFTSSLRTGPRLSGSIQSHATYISPLDVGERITGFFVSTATVTGTLRIRKKRNRLVMLL